ncbi:MAG: hypothetical protein OEY50_08710 [Nitrospinota bacterium]|nr:hypothetical protein [Nitrospinota bacterium]MDH5677826.1 hypothetical protein [Nitrospinota bacterium]MDH5757061.1 hypothetical protein [Nitrospinota bacterium]
MLCGEAGHDEAVCGFARKAADAAEKIRVIKNNLPVGAPAGLKEALESVICDLSEDPVGGVFDGKGWAPDKSDWPARMGMARADHREQDERESRLRGLLRILLNFYSSHVLANQRARSYSRQECLDDVELMLELLQETLDR